MDRAAVTQRVWELVEPLALAAGLELVDVQHRPEGGHITLRLLLDRLEADSGARVTLDELAGMSRQIGDVLDAHDVVPGAYHLECSSPGIDRPLVREDHFRRALGRRVRVETRERVGDRRRFRGVLQAVTPAGIRVEDPDAGTVEIPLRAVTKANLEFEFSAGGRPAAGRRAKAGGSDAA